MALMFKRGARTSGVRAEIGLALQVAVGVFSRHGVDCIVTSITEGVHSNGSLHYVGAAVDVRTRHLPGGSRGSTAMVVAHQIRDALTNEFDVVAENDHIHIEYQPKSGVNMAPIYNV